MTLSEDQKTEGLEPGERMQARGQGQALSVLVSEQSPALRHAASPARHSDTQVQQGAKWRNTCFLGAWGPSGKTEDRQVEDRNAAVLGDSREQGVAAPEGQGGGWTKSAPCQHRS